MSWLEAMLSEDDQAHVPPPVSAPSLTTAMAEVSWPQPYYCEENLRRVAPYYYTYNTFCKLRWRDRRLLDIFASEFRDRTLEYYKGAIADGRVVVNGQKVPEDYVLKNGEVISHTLHRHEPPVTAQPVKVIREDDDMIVINKPAGVPVHPAGRYRFNSVVEIMRLEREHVINPLPCNRLDRLTSGVMFIGKNAAAAEDISEKLRERTVRKEYLARVNGRFPDGNENGVIVCEENVVTISPILGLNRVREGGKSAKTLFRRLAYYPGKARVRADMAASVLSGSGNSTSRPGGLSPADGLDVGDHAQNSSLVPSSQEVEGYSIVHCLPLTGRTHQIRVHLQFLGHPISNDPIYSNRRVFGPLLGKNDSTSQHDAEIIARLSEMGKTESFASAMRGTDFDPPKPSEASQTPLANGGTTVVTNENHASPSEARCDGSNHTSELVAAYDAMVADYEKARGEKMTGEHCQECGTPLYSDPGPNELGIYLHAICYRDLGKRKDSPSQDGTDEVAPAFRDGGWCYESPVPMWAWPPNEKGEGEAGDSETGKMEPSGITSFKRWNDEWSPGLMNFDRETVVPNGGKLKGHQ